MTKVNVQDAMLNELRKDNIPVTIFTTNGVKIDGTVMSFDSFTICLIVNKRQQLIFKHAVSTIIPSRNISLNKEVSESE